MGDSGNRHGLFLSELPRRGAYGLRDLSLPGLAAVPCRPRDGPVPSRVNVSLNTLGLRNIVGGLARHSALGCAQRTRQEAREVSLWPRHAGPTAGRMPCTLASAAPVGTEVTLGGESPVKHLQPFILLDRVPKFTGRGQLRSHPALI